MIYSKYLDVPGQPIDLGLSSGNLWSDRNLGASLMSDFGNYFSWGEINPKPLSKYNKENYTTNPSKFRDAARTHWGGNWTIPSSEDFRELFNNTKLNLNCDELLELIGKNGNSIRIPFAGYYNRTFRKSDPELDGLRETLFLLL